MSHRDRDPPAELQPGFERYKRECEPGLPDERIRGVYQRVRSELWTSAQPRRSRWPLVAMGAATATLLVVSVLFAVSTWRQQRVRGDIDIARAPQSRLLMASGDVDVVVDGERRDNPDAVDDAQHVSFRLRPRARVEMALAGRARVALVGPAQLEVDGQDGIRLSEGRAVFSVRHAKGSPFSLRTGSTIIAVLGTRFAVVAQGGELGCVFVDEGVVELQSDAEPARRLQAGEVFISDAVDGESCTRAQEELETGFVTPEREAWQSAASLSVTSTPEGATVRVLGQQMGETPLWLQVPAGDIDVAVHKRGFREWSSTVSMGAGEGRDLLVELVRPKAPRKTTVETDALWRAARAALADKACHRVDRKGREIVRRDPPGEQQAHAWMLRAECYVRTGKRTRGLQHYIQVVEQYPDTPSAEIALFEVAKLNGDLGKYRRAYRFFSRYLETYPSGRLADAATYRSCESLVRSERLDEAAACLEGYRKRFGGPRADEGLLLLADRELALQHWSRASKLYRDYLKRVPKGRHSERAAYALVLCLEQLGSADLSRAIADYLERFPNGEHRGQIERRR